ncbi:hypothetical protein AcW2_001217 [Taiwanofungus camphoratus]|nr:hypothetical protein AcW2_001217 [Antrodia cinnamomea]
MATSTYMRFTSNGVSRKSVSQHLVDLARPQQTSEIVRHTAIFQAQEVWITSPEAGRTLGVMHTLPQMASALEVLVACIASRCLHI